MKNPFVFVIFLALYVALLFSVGSLVIYLTPLEITLMWLLLLVLGPLGLILATG